MSRLKYWYIAPELMHAAGDGLFQYQGKVGEPLSLKEIAEAIGFEWREIAQLNWGTDDPEEIAWYIEYYIKGKVIPPDDSELPDLEPFDPQAPLPEGAEILLPRLFDHQPRSLRMAEVRVSRRAIS